MCCYIQIASCMDKLQLTGLNLGRVFNFRFGHLHAEHFWCYWEELPNLKLKTRPKQLLGSLPLFKALNVIMLSATYKPPMLSVIMLNVVMLRVVAPMFVDIIGMKESLGHTINLSNFIFEIIFVKFTFYELPSIG